MNITTLALSDIDFTDTGWKIASCEKYWVIVEGTPGNVFLWDGVYWNDQLGSAALYDREAAELGSCLLEGSPEGVHHPVNLADYLRADRQMAGYPRYQAGKLRHSGSYEALRSIYQVMLGGTPQEGQ
jgi:hypothetical protein